MTGLEFYYRPGPLMVGSEFMFQNVDAPDNGNPYLHGGDVFVAWNVTGETRSTTRPADTSTPYHRPDRSSTAALARGKS